ncbi:hypothetical protein B0H16DRAFT_1523868 [Mycena metata]|uniref:Uncharacterized protein n=1 Tax=Mycena metata TaxID=1033252 RepID=A0AAD7NLD0_9AGAR|nr:hypothetical protein B0H16DRAFT_1523868 [Mycena metata]
MPSVRDIGPGLEGQDIYALKIIFLRLTAAAVSYGIFFCIGTLSSYTLIRRGLHGQRARQALLLISLTMLIAATAHLAVYIGYVLLQFPTLAAEYVDPTVIRRRLNISLTCLRRLTYFLSDIIVCWRAWVLWPDNRIVHAALAVCMTGTGATTLTLLVFDFKSEFHGVHYSQLTQNFLGTFGLLVTNFFVTVLIGYKLWYYRHNVKKYINRPGNKNTKVESILILLMESGGLYCAFWILLIVGDFGYYGPDFGCEWFQPNISGIYSTLVIYMVSRQMMFSEEVFSNISVPSLSPTERSIWLSDSVVGRLEAGPPEPNDSLVMLNSLAREVKG